MPAGPPLKDDERHLFSLAVLVLCALAAAVIGWITVDPATSGP